MRKVQRLTLGLLAALPLASCTCGDGPGIKSLRGNLSSPPVVDFGNVLVGLTATQDLEVKNVGNGTLRVTKIELGPDFSSPTYEFKVVPSVPFNLSPQEKKKLKITFLPLMAGDAMSTFRFVTDDPEDNNPMVKKSVTVRVVGKGIVAGLSIEPNPVDFGTVLAGASRTLDIRITNQLTIPVDVTTKVAPDGKPEVISQVGQGRFEIISMVQPNGSLLPTGQLGPMQSVTVQAKYTPDAAASGTQDRAKWVLSNCPDPLCDVPVTLLGRGTNAALECEPGSINFGDVNPGRTLSRMVTCKNSASDSITIAAWKIDLASGREFGVVPYPGTPSNLGPGEQFSVEVNFSPTLATLASGMSVTGTLVVPGVNPRSGRDLTPVRIELTGKAGGPTISVAPTHLEFGRVAIGTSARRRLLIANSGYSTLVVAMIVPDGMSGRMFTPDRSLLSLAVGSSTIVNVTFNPMLEGPITSDLILSSNDSSNPELHVPMSGEGRMLPPCVYTVTPSNVNFGVVPTFEMRTQGVRIENIGSDQCLMNDIEVTTATSAASRSRFFRLINGNETGVVLDPGQAKDLPLMYSPRLAGSDRGILTFYISDPMNSTPQIPLFGIAEASTNVVCPADVTTPAGTPVTLMVDAMSIGGSITSINWTVTSSPAGGLGTPGFWTPNPPIARSETILPYIVGRYTIHVVVRDSNGRMASCDTHILALGHGLRVQLTWDGSGDVDLHLHNRNMTPWFGQVGNHDDCYYSDRNPIWDMTAGPAMGGNPQLDFDNVTGFGPENTRIDVVEVGVPYTIGVHNYGRADGRISTIQIFCGGVTSPTATFVSTPLTGGGGGNCTANGFWKPASVTFSSQTTCVVTPIGQYGASSQFCSMF